jgi:5-amino-6-(5-phospho-D-ribitylamino)uracil phosphatase
MLYVSDLDGTLLNKSGKLGPLSRELLSIMLSNGLQFTVASARSVHSISQMLEGLELPLPVIEFNGAFISELNGRHIVINSLNEAVKHGVYLEIQRAGFLPFISTYDGERDNLYHSDITNEGMRWYYEDRIAMRDPRLRPPRRLEDILDEQVICFTTIDREEALRPLEERLRLLYGDTIKLHLFRHLYCPGWSWLTVHDARACKAKALKTLMNSKGIDATELTVFGDDINDIEMFELAGRAVAVSNALDEVKRRADVMIGSNEEDSVARFIQSEWINLMEGKREKRKY